MKTAGMMDESVTTQVRIALLSAFSLPVSALLLMELN
jgi:hypothetical protein